MEISWFSWKGEREVMKRDVEMVLEAIAVFEDEIRIQELEDLVRKLNKELWVKNRTSVTR